MAKARTDHAQSEDIGNAKVLARDREPEGDTKNADLTCLLREWSHSSLSYRLLAYILAFSSIFTLFGTGTQLFWEYQTDVEGIQGILQQIEDSHLSSLTTSQWMLDDQQIQAQMEGILRLPDVHFVELQSEEESSPISVGSPITERSMTRLYPMLYQHRDRQVHVGTLKIAVSLDGVYARLREKFLVILGTQAIRTFATSLFILFIVQALITRHLNTLGNHAERLRLDELDTSLSLNRPPNRRPDEFDHVVAAMEKMRKRLIADLSSMKAAEEEREWLIADLETKNTEMENFARTVSHDLKSPLITIQGFLSLLRKDLAKGNIERAEKDITRISSATNKMYQLLEDLLTLSRAGRLIGKPENIDLHQMAHEAVELLTGQIEAAGIEVDVSSNLPVVSGDRSRLQAVFQNLIENSAKFMGNQVAPRIEIGVRTHSDETVFYVADNGIGIDRAQQKKVFGLFNKLDQHATGTGIGLALVHRIIEVHHGRIWIESDGSDKGCTFCFTLPGRGPG